ncbi:MAG: phosphoenolpyruvate--protein phosphotransferase [Desulfobacteraceae bacterium]|nr:phosphoenolpyruvate--protein phosphotransferase [Desulfobacteraceae bacterium]
MSEALQKEETRLPGIDASPGICIGKAYLLDNEGVNIVERYPVAKGQLKNEQNRFKAAVKRAEKELQRVIQNTPEYLRQNTAILEAHLVLLKDKMLYGKTLEAIEKEGINAEWALKMVVTQARNMFASMEDAYFRERVSDIIHVSDRILQNLMGSKPVDIGAIDKRVILVARDLSPAETSQIHLERVKGFVTDLGGKASHTSIIARTLEIPAVQGVGDATRKICTDDLIIVDGIEGVVILHPEESTLVEYSEREVEFARRKATLARLSHRPARTRDGIDIKVMGNIELPEEVVSVLDHGGDGIGLYRTEFQYLSRPFFPTEEELFDRYCDVVEVMAGLPVTIRTLDINGDKALANGGVPGAGEVNPALGLRGIRYCLKKTEVFRTQLRAILRAAAFGPIRVLFPMIATLEEVVEAKRCLREAAESLEKEGTEHGADVSVGVMIEVPSAVITAEALAERVDFFSIGTNDLIQYSLAIDRGNREVMHLFQPLDPAILRLLKITADAAKAGGIPLYMCGEMASYPIHLPVLIGLGIQELSMNPQAIPAVKNTLRALDTRQSRDFLEELLKQRSANAAYGLLAEAYGKLVEERSFPTEEEIG